MLKIIGIIILAIIVIAVGLWGYARYKFNNMKDTHDLEKRIDKICNDLIKKDSVESFCIAVVKGDEHYIKGFGWADKENKIPIDSNTIFEIGSISKVFTTELAEILSQKGMIDWNASINNYLPENLRGKQYENTTLLHLATHTSGFPRLPESLLSKMTDECNPYASLTMADFEAYIKNPTDKKQPDTKVSDYSNVGNGLLGHILEWASGKSFDSLLHEEIISKLAMTSTGLNVKDSTRFATGYDVKGNKTCHWDLPIMYSAGAIRSDMVDMVKFAKANLHGELKNVFKETQKPQYDLPVGKGWQIDKTMNAIIPIGTTVWHNGGTGGFSSYIGFSANDNIAIIILANQGEVNEKIESIVPLILMAAKKVSFKKQ